MKRLFVACAIVVALTSTSCTASPAPTRPSSTSASNSHALSDTPPTSRPTREHSTVPKDEPLPQQSAFGLRPQRDGAYTFDFATLSSEKFDAEPSLDGAIKFAEYYFTHHLNAAEKSDHTTIAQYAWPYCGSCNASIMTFATIGLENNPYDQYQSTLPYNAYDGKEIAPQHYSFKTDMFTMTGLRTTVDGEVMVYLYTSLEKPLPGTFEVSHGANGWQMVKYDPDTISTENSVPESSQPSSEKLAHQQTQTTTVES